MYFPPVRLRHTFNLPPAAPSGNHLHDVGFLHRMRGGKRIVVHHLTIRGGGCELTPIHQQGVISIPQRHRTDVPIGVDLMALAGPPFTDSGFNATATLQKLDPLIQQRMGLGFAHQDEFKSLRQHLPTEGFMAVQVIAEHGYAQGCVLAPPAS
jgi:hypothetical protein